MLVYSLPSDVPPADLSCIYACDRYTDTYTHIGLKHHHRIHECLESYVEVYITATRITKAIIMTLPDQVMFKSQILNLSTLQLRNCKGTVPHRQQGPQTPKLSRGRSMQWEMQTSTRSRASSAILGLRQSLISARATAAVAATTSMCSAVAWYSAFSTCGRASDGCCAAA